MATLYIKNFKCVFCGKDFKDDVVAPSNTFVRQDTDFRTHAPGGQQIPYCVHTCPFCGFTDYLHQEPLENDERRRIEEYLYSYWLGVSPGSISPAQKYEWLANIFVLRNMPSIETAQAYLRAAWMAEDETNIDSGNRFREHAKAYFVKALENHEVEGKKVPVITYLVGELNRRLGKFSESLEWFSRVKSEDLWLIKLCKQQEFFASIEKSVNTRIPDV